MGKNIQREVRQSQCYGQGSSGIPGMSDFSYHLLFYISLCFGRIYADIKSSRALCSIRLICQMGIIILLFSFLLAAVTPSSLSAYQVVFWQGNNVLKYSSDTPANFTYPYPYPYSHSYQRALVFGGFSFYPIDRVFFRADFVEISDAVDTIEFKVYESFRLYYISFHILLIDSRSQWLWMLSGSYNPAKIDKTTSPDISQYPTIPLSVPIINRSDCQVSVYLKDYNLTHTPTNSDQKFLLVSISLQSLGTSSITLRIDRHYSQARILNISYVIVIVDKHKMGSHSVNYHRSIIYIWYQRSTNYRLFGHSGPNLGIPDIFASENGFDGSCLIGIYKIYLASIHTFTLIDLGTNPIQPIQNLPNPAQMDMGVYWIALCVLQIFYEQRCQNLFGYLHCHKCQMEKCLQCREGFYLERNQCFCLFGYPLQGLCNTIPGCTQPFKLPDGSLGCLSCNQTHFKPDPVNYLCQCLHGNLVNWICNTIVGCKTPSLNGYGSIICQFCNITDHFESTPVNNGSSCQCKQHYQLKGQRCKEICGDGVLFSEDKAVCDDGNTIDHDGCSADCSVEAYYRCSTNSTSTPSSCVYQGLSLNVSLDSVEKATDANRAIFRFKLTPYLLFLNKLDFTSNVSLLCNSEYQIGQVTYDQGYLTILADYTKDMEGVSCSLEIQYPQTVAEIQNNSLIFNAVSRNQKLIITQSLQTGKTLKNIFRFLSYCVLAIFLISLPHKMIGAQIITNCQLVYLSYSFYSSQSYFFSSIMEFRLVTGYRTLFHQEIYEEMLYSFTYTAELSRQWLENNLIGLAVIVVLWLIVLICQGYRWVKEPERKVETLQRDSELFEDKTLLKYMYNHLIFPFTVFNILFSLISAYVNNIRVEVEGSLNPSLNNLSFFIGCSLISIVLGIQIMNASRRINRKRDQMKSWYIPWFLIRSVALSCLISLATTAPLTLISYAVIGILLLSIVIDFIGRPYRKVFPNLTLILFQTTSLYAFALTLLINQTSLEEDTEILLVFMLQGLICVCILLSLTRIVLHCCQLCKSVQGSKQSGQKNEKSQPKKAKKKYDEVQNRYFQQTQRIRKRQNLVGNGEDKYLTNNIYKMLRPEFTSQEREMVQVGRNFTHNTPDINLQPPRRRDNVELQELLHRHKEDFRKKKNLKGKRVVEEQQKY